ncbi:SNF2 domain-containing protein CLASSY 2-like [Vicia villosa]|uniref:SNF2 domain-containing protein CLASSY 2-like n=1 Tax=Vicia villosa TaxID=3911 RepID=UPI00273B9689|nr:SNF2 domain-containing protein CLASSY 2-like [Vicia villosa]
MAPPKKRNLHQWKHPFDSDYPFEAVLSGSWQPVKLIEVSSGKTTLHFMDTRQIQTPLTSSSDIRIGSRKAASSDCSNFLRSGIDISILLGFCHHDDNSYQFSPIPMWIDARINSIHRQPHDESDKCSCQFYVNFYDDQGSLGTEMKTLSKKDNAIGIDQIFILQRLQHNTSEGLLKENNNCEVKPYRWDSSEDCSSLSQTRLILGKFLSDLSWFVMTSFLKKVSFSIRSFQNKLVYQVMGNDTDVTSPFLIDVVNFNLKNGSLVPIISQFDAFHDYDGEEDEASPMQTNEIGGLRRSRRRNVQPERYIGCAVEKLAVGNFRTWPYKRGTYVKRNDNSSSDSDSDSDSNSESEEDDSESDEKVNEAEKTNEVKLGDAEQNDHGDEISLKYDHLTDDIVEAKNNGADVLNSDPCNDQSAISCVKEVDDNATLGRYYSYCREKNLKRKQFDHDLDDIDFGNKWEGICFKNGAQTKRFRWTNINQVHDEQRHKGSRMYADASKEMIDTYMKNFDSLPTEEEKNVNEPWQETSKLEPREEEKTSKSDDEEEESPENLEALWQEMNTALTSSYLLIGNEDSNAAEVSADTEKESKETCEHDFRLEDEIGIYCTRCGFVKTAIRDISEPIMENPKWHKEEKQCSGEDKPEPKVEEVDNKDLFLTRANDLDEPISTENENVWELIPELKEQMHAHQKKAFEFLWRNIAGSMEPALMKENSETSGGCVISHAPGAGKTFLIISFLVSYLKLFPGKRPLVLAPKTTLYTWRKEFKKWKIPVPVYLIHARQSSRDLTTLKSTILPGVPKPTSGVKHVLDCINKIQKWNSHPSVLVMGYTSFFSLMRSEETKFEHRKYMAKALRENPGILILDEGHNPRSTKSRLRKCLMKVPTELRILLSGTLFQNNFCEYFNTLSLARPKFVHEVLHELDSKYRRNGEIMKKAPHLLEARARKFFLDNIEKKINSDIDEEKMFGLNLLRKMTTGFIDVYDSGNSSDTLPGLQIYTLLMNTNDEQHEIIQKLQKKMAKSSSYLLEVELLITLGSIHPWLIKTAAACAAKFFTDEELKKLETSKFDLRKGSKVRFVLSLISRVVKNEKVLIFCHNLAPIRFLIELFEKYFQWQNGKEVLLLTGELDLFERGKVIDKFEDPRGSSKVLLASINACAEGISLTAASRVIFLDSEWNPSKTKQAIARAFRPGQQKMVYVYQLLTTGSMEEDKFRRTIWKEWISCMIFSQEFVENPSKWQTEKIEDDILREMVEEDKSKAIHMIMKNEKASTT